MQSSSNTNVGKIDRIVRIFTAWVCLYYGFIAPLIADALFANILGFFGLITLLSSVFQRCPIYSLAGVNIRLSVREDVPRDLLKTKRYFLFIFTLLMMATFVIFSLVAFHTAGEIQQDRETVMLKELFREQTGFIEQYADVNDLSSLRQVVSELHGFIGYVFATEKGYVIHPLSQHLTAEAPKRAFLPGHWGIIQTPKYRRYWEEIPLQNSVYQLLFVYDIHKPIEHLLDLLNWRLLIASVVLCYCYIWGILIGTRYISTKFYKLNAARQESEALTSLLLKSTAEAIYGVDMEGNCTFCNPATLAALGYNDASEVLGRNVHLLMHHSYADGSQYPIHKCPLALVIKQGVAIHEDDEVFWRADGTFFPVEYWGHPVIQNDKIEAMVITFLDISKRKQTEKEMRKLSSVVEQSKDLIVLADNQGMITYANPAFKDITGIDRGDAVSKHISVLHETLTEREEVDRISKTLNADKIYQDSLVNHRKNGEPYYLELSVFGLKNCVGEIESIVYSGRDVTEQLDIEESIRQSNKERVQAEAANLSKSMFLANMSHEIRTPMTAIVGFAESLLEESMSEDERTEAVTTIIRGGRHLTRIINDILDLSKIEANRIEIESTPLDLFELMCDIHQIIDIQAQQKTIKLQIDFKLPFPKQINSDPTRLKQILLNLISNAVKFTEQGHVIITISYQADDHLIFVNIEDTGIGLSPEHQRKLFNPFSQADSSTTRNYGGTGLGLHISKQLAEKMGGTITVSSALGQGSTFTLSIDSGLSENLQVEQLIHDIEEVSFVQQRVKDGMLLETIHAANILIAEDSKVSQALLKRLFKNSKSQITIVENGELAVEEVFKQDYDLVLTDIHMPVMDGREATRAMREKGFAKPIIAITANVMRDDIQSYHDAGCDAVIPKPIEKHQFFSILNEYLRATLDNRYQPKHLPVTVPQLSGNILLAEDNVDNQRLIKLLIDKTGADLTITEDGLSAIEHTLANEYHLILMDINMPLMGGLEATQKLRKAAYTLPIIAITADTDKDKVEEFEAAGYDGYLSKPVDKQRLYGVLKKYLPSANRSTPTPSQPPPQKTTEPQDDMDDDIQGLMSLFLERLPPMIEQIDTAIRDDDWQTVASVTHNIKGTAGSFGHPELTELAAGLSKCLKNQAYDEAKIAFAAVKAYAEAVMVT